MTSQAGHAPSPFILRHPILTALALSLGTAVALDYLLGVLALAPSIIMSLPARTIPTSPTQAAGVGRWRPRGPLFGLIGYLFLSFLHRQISYVSRQIQALKLIVENRFTFSLEAMSSSQAHLSFF
ncbi:hypothetical protein [Herbaspirillum sp.]|uniref:hypothetical protein n=1 Tax=Herbaspirillum sp. TaxID=1890675 RepID=UPI0031D0B348